MPMEPDARRLLKRVIASLSAGMLWLIINMTIGIYLEWLFFDEYMTMGNYIFYSFLILSLAGLIWYNIRLWK